MTKHDYDAILALLQAILDGAAGIPTGDPDPAVLEHIKEKSKEIKIILDKYS